MHYYGMDCAGGTIFHEEGKICQLKDRKIIENWYIYKYLKNEAYKLNTHHILMIIYVNLMYWFRNYHPGFMRQI